MLLLGPLLALNLVVAGTIGFLIFRSYQQYYDKAALIAGNVSRVLDGNLTRLIQKIDLSLLSTVDELERQQLEDAGGGLIDALVARDGSRLPEALGLRVSNARGEVERSTGPTAGPVGMDIGHRDYFLRHRHDPNAGLVISASFVGRWQQRPLVTFSRRINTASGEFAGVVAAPVAIESLADLLSEVDLGPRATVSLWDVTLGLVARAPVPADYELASVKPSERLVELIRADAGPTTYYNLSTVDEIGRLTFFRKVSGWPLYLVIGIAERDFMAGWHRDVGVLVGLAALFLIISSAAALVIGRAMRALETQDGRLRMALSAARQGWFEADLRSGEVANSPEYAGMLGFEPGEFSTDVQKWRAAVHPDDVEAAEVAFRSGVGPGSSIDVEFRRASKTGEWRWIRSVGRTVEWDDAGKPVKVAGIHMDVTERKESEIRLQLAASVFTEANEGIMITDAEGRIVEVNDAFTRLTGYRRSEAVGLTPRILSSGLQPAEYYAAMWRSLVEIGHWRGELWNRRKDGALFAELLTVSAVRDPAGRIQSYVGLFTDITAMKEHQRQLEHIAHYDMLTSLPNRVLLDDRLRHGLVHCQRRGRSLAVVYIDLDGFKEVNDRHGHDAGDHLLIIVGQRLKAALREGDTLARIGGDEFVAVLADIERLADCELVLGRLLKTVSEPVPLDGCSLQVSASIGVTLYPEDRSDADLLLRHADQAMYVAKQSGKNRYHRFDVVQDAAVKSQHETLDRIRGALDRREFVLHYQPKVNMKNGAVIGVEALIRWQHPERGLLPPAAFLPLVEAYPTGVEIGEWVIGEALRQAAEWRAAGLDLRVSVNICARQLQQNDFVPRLAALLAAQSAVPADRLELEIVETSALEDIEQVSAILHACRAIGVQVALDDFGTGYSSLTYLRRLPTQLIKIDQSFVRDMLQDPEDMLIVRAVVDLARSFQRGVIAEGVETAAHGRALLSFGCELAQGYGIARPMPAGKVADWIAEWEVRPAEWPAAEHPSAV